MAQSACATALAEPARSGPLAKAATPSDSAVPAPLPAGIHILRDVAYGTDGGSASMSTAPNTLTTRR